MDNQKLTYKQQLFVNEYIIDGNATRAAKEAGYSERTAKDMGCQNLAKPYIKLAIEQAKAQRARRVNKTADQVMADLEETRLLAMEKGQLSAAVRCSELQGKHLAMFTDKIEQTTTIQESMSETERMHRLQTLLDMAAERIEQNTGSDPKRVTH